LARCQGSTANIYYRQGTANSDGTITWDSNEVLVTTEAGYDATVCKDSDGYPWISYDSSTYNSKVVKATAKNGSTWGTPTTLWTNRQGSGGENLKIIPLTGGKMLAISSATGLVFQSRLYDGSTWAAAVNASTSTPQDFHYYDAGGDGDNVHLAFCKTTSYDIVYVKYTYGTGWGSEETVESATVSQWHPSITLKDTDKVRVFYLKSQTNIRYRDRDSGSWQTAVDISTTESTMTCVTSSYKAYSSKICVTWKSTFDSTIYVRFESYTTGGLTYQRSADQTLTFQAISSRQTSNQRSTVQPLQFLLQSSRQSSSIRLVNQALISVASATRQLTVVRTPEQQLPFLTETSRQTSYARIFDQAVSFLQAVARQFTGFRTADQNFLILTETARSTSYQRTSSTALSIMADALRTLSTPRTASQIVTVLTEASRTATYSRTALQALSALTETARQLTLPRSPTQTLSILATTSRSQTLQRTVSQIVSVLLSATRQATYTRPVNQPLNFLATSTMAKIIGRTASQVLTILAETARQLTLNRFVSQPLNILLSATRQASYSRTAEVLLQINTQTAIKFIVYIIVPTPTPTPPPVPVIPSIQLDAIIQTAHITSLWWQKTTTLEVLVINKGTVASDVTFGYALLDQNNQIITQGTQTVFISGLDKKTVYINIPTPPDGNYTIQFRTTQPVKVEVKSAVTVETPFYGRLSFTILIIFLLALAIYAVKKRRR
jgi:hypothetical protein